MVGTGAGADGGGEVVACAGCDGGRDLAGSQELEGNDAFVPYFAAEIET